MKIIKKAAPVISKSPVTNRIIIHIFIPAVLIMEVQLANSKLKTLKTKLNTVLEILQSLLDER